MYEFVFIDPSPNMELLAKYFQSNIGHTVLNIYTKNFNALHIKNLWVFAGDKHFRLNDKKNTQEADPMVFKLKKPFFTKFCLRNLKEKLSKIDPLLSNGTFKDYILLTGQFKVGADLPITISNLSFDEIVAKFPTSTIIASRVPAQSGKHTITHWQTDYDIAEVLGDDYYFFYDGKTRYELYKEDNYLVTVTEQKIAANWLPRINPTLARFSFKKAKSVNFHQNQNPWLQKYSSKIYLVNDYSWQRLAVQMPENWFKAFKKLLFIEKKR